MKQTQPARYGQFDTCKQTFPPPFSITILTLYGYMNSNFRYIHVDTIHMEQ